MISEKLGKDPIDIATLNLHGPTDYMIPTLFQALMHAWQRGKR
jgi:hypothetical protein